MRKVNEEIPRCLITLLRALLETWSPGFFYVCASVKIQVGWAKDRKKEGKEIGKTMLLASGPQGLWRDSCWKERHRDGGKGHPGHTRAWLPLQSPSPAYDFLQTPLVGTNYGNHGKVLFLERTFRRAWPGRSRAGRLEGTLSTTESLWADLCGSWGCPSCALPAPYLTCTCTYVLSLPLPCPFFQTIPFQSVKTLHLKEWRQMWKRLKQELKAFALLNGLLSFHHSPSQHWLFTRQI